MHLRSFAGDAEDLSDTPAYRAYMEDLGFLPGTTVQTDNASEFVGFSRKVRGGPTLFEESLEHYTGRLVMVTV